MAKLSESIREAIRKSPLTQAEISRQTGISEGQISGFLKGTRGLTLATLDSLCEFLGVQIITKTRRK